MRYYIDTLLHNYVINDLISDLRCQLALIDSTVKVIELQVKRDDILVLSLLIDGYYIKITKDSIILEDDEKVEEMYSSSTIKLFREIQSKLEIIENS